MSDATPKCHAGTFVLDGRPVTCGTCGARIPNPPTRCPVTGYLVVDGRRIRALRCQLDAGHEVERRMLASGTPVERGASLWGIAPVRLAGTPHAVTFEWEDDAELAADWPEAYDPDEPIDVDVPELEPEALARIADEQADAHRERRAFGDD